jgi:hypothetical protein
VAKVRQEDEGTLAARDLRVKAVGLGIWVDEERIGDEFKVTSPALTLHGAL